MVAVMQDWFVFTLFLQHKIALKIVIAVLGLSCLTEGFSANRGFLFCFCLSPLLIVGRLENNLKHISQVHTGLNVCIFILKILTTLLKESSCCKPDCTALTPTARNQSIVETSRDFQWKRDGLKAGPLHYANTISCLYKLVI